MNRTLLRWLPALLWATGIFILSAWSSPPKMDKVLPMADKAVHWTLFSVQCWFIASALRSPNRSLPATVGLAILLASGYGAVDEFHQHYVPNRTCDFMDWLADTLGASAAAGAFYAYETHRSAQANRPTA